METEYRWMGDIIPKDKKPYIEDKLIEEMAELTQALIKFRTEPTPDRAAHLIEEVSHVQIHLEIFNETVLHDALSLIPESAIPMVISGTDVPSGLMTTKTFPGNKLHIIHKAVKRLRMRNKLCSPPNEIN